MFYALAIAFHNFRKSENMKKARRAEKNGDIWLASCFTALADEHGQGHAFGFLGKARRSASWARPGVRRPGQG